MELVIVSALYAVSMCGMLILGLGLFRKDRGKDNTGESKYRQWKVPFVYVPGFLISMFLFNIWKMGWLRAIEWLTAFGFSFALTISLYYLLLNFCLKVFRRFWNAKTCTVFWFVPTFLAALIGGWPLPAPKWVICLKPTVLWIAAAIWFAGFTAVWIWKLREDRVFRREIMTGATVVTDQRIWEILYEEMEKAGMEPEYTPPKHKKDNDKAPLYKIGKKLWYWMSPPEAPRNIKWTYQPYDFLIRSPRVNTPMTIGGSGILPSMYDLKIILPEKEYSREDMKLILRHELVHILREDSRKKRLLVFCKALCWFNPLMWIAMRRSAEDMELSCDEAVLTGEDEQTRRRYADLILRTAGDERGFTACLSVSAESLRYRMKSIVKNQKRKNGIWLIAPLLFLLYLCYGQVALGFGRTTGAQAIFADADPAVYEITEVRIDDEEEYKCASAEALTQYLSGMSVSRLGGNFRPTGELAMTVVCDGPKGSFEVWLCGRFLEIIPMYEGAESDAAYYERYYLHADLDWDYIRSLLN